MQTEAKDVGFSVDEKVEEDGKSRNVIGSRSNNHHVVPIGILTVLCTVYLIIGSLQCNHKVIVKPGVNALSLPKPNIDSQTNPDQVQTGEGVLDNQFEYPTCRRVEVFSNQMNGFKSGNGRSMTSQQLLRRRRHLKSKPTGIGYRQSRTGKGVEANKKKDLSKKPNTAEPIIYLFALVFIYLLLKAASDINQHYKSQNKGDKRLRRCSLQSYAQKEQRNSHQDRRASKGISSKSLPKF